MKEDYVSDEDLDDEEGSGGEDSAAGAAARRVHAEVRSEASWVILNASSCGSDAQIEELVEYG